jgi:hypothetical protein
MICAGEPTPWGHDQFYDITDAPNAFPGCLPAHADSVRARGIHSIFALELLNTSSET